MVLSVRAMFIIGVGFLLITKYYLEKQYKSGDIFWGFSALSLILGLMAGYTVVTDHPSRQYYIPLTVIAIVMATLYYQTEEELSSASG